MEEDKTLELEYKEFKLKTRNVDEWIKRYCLNKDIIQVLILDDGTFTLHNKSNDMFFVF